MANRVPERLNTYNCYADGAKLIGLVDVELPKPESFSEEISGAGVAGAYDSPTIGHFKPMTVKLNFRTVTNQFAQLLEPRYHMLELRASMQVQDSGLGTLTQKGYQVTLRAMPKAPDFGKMETGKPTGDSFEMEVLYMKIVYDGTELMMIDKPNFVYRVNGVDYLKEVRDLI